VAAVDVINEVLDSLSALVATDGGSMRIGRFDEAGSTLVVDYTKGTNEACAMCVIDSESLAAFVEEGVKARGLDVAHVTIHERPLVRS